MPLIPDNVSEFLDTYINKYIYTTITMQKPTHVKKVEIYKLCACLTE